MSDLRALCLQFLQKNLSVYSYRECVDMRQVAAHFNYKLLVSAIDRHCGQHFTQVKKCNYTDLITTFCAHSYMYL